MKIRVILPEKHSKCEYPDSVDIPIDELSKIENGTCNEIYLKRILEYIEKPFVLIELCKQKLRKGGKIHIESIDLLEISRGYYLGIISLEDVNDYIIGTKYLHSIHDALEWVRDKCVIKTKSVDDYIYYIEGAYNV